MQMSAHNICSYKETQKKKHTKTLHKLHLTSPIMLGPVVRSIFSLMSSLRVISLTVLADSIYNILIFFAEKM